ncbi:uncharacterized protein LOC114190453 isoform X1 [Vigna unguiculata]|uniref:uncharacterized protein LOC114190453 isoform X1 n=1 Tax=Vigna unguiculata TaxID=3917 RepID=UPI0010165A1F|nr:uncharacterized protein LOC114190453 isoform X1 [Vigna unguiculata]
MLLTLVSKKTQPLVSSFKLIVVNFAFENSWVVPSSCSCSLVCYKKHKELPCVKPQPLEALTTAVSESLVEKAVVVGETSEVLQKFQLEAIASSSEIRDSLNDKALQDLICRIDSSSNAEDELDKAMAEEAFRLFTDKILSTINP